MADLPTFRDLFRRAQTEALIRGRKLAKEMVERDGSDANIIVAAGCAAADEVVGHLTRVAAARFLDSAEKKSLDRLVFDLFGMLRKSAAPAVTTVEFRTGVPAPAQFAIPVNTKVANAEGVEYVTTAAAIYPAASVGPVFVPVRSVLVGFVGHSKPGTITNIKSQIVGSPADLVVTNTLATTGAAEDESDPELRSRARAFFLTARRGTLAAIEARALDVAGVQSAKAFESLDAYGRPARYVTLVVTDGFVEQLLDFAVVPPAYVVQSQLFASQVFAGLSDTRAGGIFVLVLVARLVMLPVRLDLRFQAGVNPDLVASMARAAVVNYTNALSPGSAWLVAEATNALRQVPGLHVTGADIASPAGDVVPRPLEVVRTAMALVTAYSVSADVSLLGVGNPDAYLLTIGILP